MRLIALLLTTLFIVAGKLQAQEISKAIRPFTTYTTETDTFLGRSCHTYTFPDSSFFEQCYDLESGKLVRECSGINGQVNGLIKGYYPNGNLSYIHNMLYGCYFGPSMEWHDNGQLSASGYYWLETSEYTIKRNLTGLDTMYYCITDTSLVTGKPQDYLVPVVVEMGCGARKDKAWKYYSSSGKLVREEVWDKGKLLYKKNYI